MWMLGSRLERLDKRSWYGLPCPSSQVKKSSVTSSCEPVVDPYEVASPSPPVQAAATSDAARSGTPNVLRPPIAELPSLRRCLHRNRESGAPGFRHLGQARA